MAKPFILGFSVPQKHVIETKSYHYSSELNLNVVGTGKTIVPFVEAGLASLELGTRTDVKAEGTDCSSPHSYSVLQMDTMTKVAREGTDSSMNHIELETETRVMREGTDVGYSALLELLTKTEVLRERDE